MIEPPAMSFPLSDEVLAEHLATCNTGDPERDHIDADSLLCRQLAALGYTHSVTVFQTLKKWYA